VEVHLEGIYLIFTPQAQKDWQIMDTISPQIKDQALKAYTEEALQKLEQKVKEGLANDGKMSFWERIMVKVIDNIQISVKDVHIRFEDNTFRKSPYGFGFTLQDLSIVTTSEIWEPQFIDRTEEANRNRPLHKYLKLTNFSFYWESQNATMISNLGSEPEIENGLKKMGANIPKRAYILKPLSLEVKSIQSGKSNDYTKPRYLARFAIDTLIFKMHKDQFDNIVELSKIIEQYQKLQFSYEDTKKYKNLRPLYQPSIKSSKQGLLKTYKPKNENAVLWWKYSIECVRKIIKEKKGFKGQFRITDAKLRLYQQEFMLLYAKVVNNKGLNEIEQLRYYKILNIFDIQQLKLYFFLVRLIKKDGQVKYWMKLRKKQ